MGAQVLRTKGKSVAEEVAKVVREKHITQVVFGRSAQSGWRRYLYLSAIHKFLRDAPAGGRAHRYARGEVRRGWRRTKNPTSWWWTTSRRSLAC